MRTRAVWAPLAASTACYGVQRLSRMFLPLSTPTRACLANQRVIIAMVRHNNSSSQLVDALPRNKIAICMGDCFGGHGLHVQMNPQSVRLSCIDVQGTAELRQPDSCIHGQGLPSTFDVAQPYQGQRLTPASLRRLAGGSRGSRAPM
jgi:hypothetical protein